MHGSELRNIRKERGLAAAWVAERAGFTPQHFSKIERKPDVSVDEFQRIARAMGIKPGDLLDNSVGEIMQFLPIIERLRRLDPAVLPQVEIVLDAIGGIAGTVGTTTRMTASSPSEAAPKGEAKEVDDLLMLGNQKVTQPSARGESAPSKVEHHSRRSSKP